MFQSAGAAAFFAAWRGLCLKTPVPHYREAFQRLPSDMIPRLVIVEEVGQEHIIRFMGTSRTESWGADLTGKDVLGLMAPSLAKAAWRNLRTVCDHPCGLHHISFYATPSGRQVHMENVTLPLANDPGLPRRILNFTEEISAAIYGEPASEIRNADTRVWLDIGAGIPKKQPVK